MTTGGRDRPTTGGAVARSEGSPEAVETTAPAEHNGEAPRPRPRIGDHWILGNDPVLGALGIGLTTVFIVAYVVHFGRLTSNVQRGYGTSAFDIGLYDQGLWLMSHLKAPFVTLMGRNLFGDHTQFLLLSLVPVYWLRPDATTLLWVQAFLLALGAVPVYMLSMRLLKQPILAAMLAGAFLLHPALSQSNLENFHPDAFLVPIVGFVIYAAVMDKRRMLVVFFVLALLGKEDTVLILLPIALWFAWRRDRRLGLILAATSALYAAFATQVVMRALIGVATLNAWRIPFGGVSGLLTTVIRKPGDFFNYLTGADRPNGRPFYAWQMIAPTALMFLVAPELALTAFLVIAWNMLSTFGYQHQIAYHYSMVPIVALLMGTVYAISKIKRSRLRTMAVVAVAASSLWCAVLWGAFPFSVHNPAWTPSEPAVQAIDRVKAKLPSGAVVSAYYGYAPHVDHRTRVYMWPTPFHAVYWNTFKQEGQRLAFADDVQYLFLPADLQDHPEVLKAIRGDFVVVARSSSAVLYKRKGT
jgi:uncharacterized membrane protein